jgi:hypothetical protein
MEILEPEPSLICFVAHSAIKLTINFLQIKAIGWHHELCTPKDAPE